MRKLKVIGHEIPNSSDILTPEALEFLEAIVEERRLSHETLMVERKTLYERTRKNPKELGFSHDPMLEQIRHEEGTIYPLSSEFWEPGVELTGPASNRKMVINALTSGAVRYMADSEDADSPTWANMIHGQINLYDAVRETISYTDPKTKEAYSLKGKKLSKLMYRVRGLHLSEPRVLFSGKFYEKPIPAALFDYSMFIFHNARELVRRGKAVHFYIPKLEHRGEAAWWDSVFELGQNLLGILPETFKATVLIENPYAVLEADEILCALRRHSAGLNVGRYDYMAGLERILPNKLFPERRQMTMMAPCMDAYVDYVGRVCYKRHAPFIGGMEAQIPVKNNPLFSEKALEKARAGKMREAHEKGCHRAWVAHPGMIDSMQEIFVNRPPDWEEKARKRYEKMEPIPAKKFFEIPKAVITEEGLRENSNARIQYVANWLSGVGAVKIEYHTLSGELYAVPMEDAATAQQSTNQDRKWIMLGAKLDDGRLITHDLVRAIDTETLEKIKAALGETAYQKGNYLLAAKLTQGLLAMQKEDFPEYFTEYALPFLLEQEKRT